MKNSKETNQKQYNVMSDTPCRTQPGKSNSLLMMGLMKFLQNSARQNTNKKAKLKHISHQKQIFNIEMSHVRKSSLFWWRSRRMRHGRFPTFWGIQLNIFFAAEITKNYLVLQWHRSRNYHSSKKFGQLHALSSESTVHDAIKLSDNNVSLFPCHKQMTNTL